MKVMAIEQYGEPDVLTLLDLPVPSPDAGEVRVRVHAVSINPVDDKRRRSGNFEGRFYDEYVVAAATDLAHKSPTLTHREVAASSMAPLTAYQALDRMSLRAGQHILVHAGSGGVGHFAVQLAKVRGAHVTATGSAGSRDFVLGLGADAVVDYCAHPFETQVSGLDAVLDTVGDETFVRSFGAVRRGGWVVSIVTKPTDEHLALAEQLGIHVAWIWVVPSRPQLEHLTSLLEVGQLRPHVSQVFALEQVAEAHRAQESGRTVGKIVLDVRPVESQTAG